MQERIWLADGGRVLLHDLLAGKPASSSLQGRRVLVVEDDYLIAQDLLEELLRCDAEVMGPVASVAEALALLQSRPAPYMAVLDIKLSDGMVYPVADALRRLGVPFIFASVTNDRVPLVGGREPAGAARCRHQGVRVGGANLLEPVKRGKNSTKRLVVDGRSP